jgi:hypothetical protein
MMAWLCIYRSATFGVPPRDIIWRLQRVELGRKSDPNFWRPKDCSGPEEQSTPQTGASADEGSAVVTLSNFTRPPRTRRWVNRGDTTLALGTALARDRAVRGSVGSVEGYAARRVDRGDQLGIIANGMRLLLGTDRKSNSERSAAQSLLFPRVPSQRCLALCLRLK